jgi:urate oxidase
MGIILGTNAYGKNAIHLSKIERHAHHHLFREITVSIHVKGDFALAHLQGDNALILPTDTQKNTVYVLAKDHLTGPVEEFALFLGDHFLEHNAQIEEVNISIAEKSWKRLSVEGQSFPHTFIEGGNQKRCAALVKRRGFVQLQSGVKDLLILKTTDSAFEKFLKDEYTVLPETSDRIMATNCEAWWQCNTTGNMAFDTTFDSVKNMLLKTFAVHKSLSVQHTLYAMGEAVLKEVPAVDEIRLVMPNRHHVPFNMAQFGMEPKNEIFIVTDAPYGYITGTVMRTKEG